MGTEQLLQISTAFIVLIVFILLLKISNKNHEIKEQQQMGEEDKEKLRKIREETNQYLKEQGYKPKIKVRVPSSSSGTVTGRHSSASENTSSASERSNSDEHHRLLNIIINSNMVE